MLDFPLKGVCHCATKDFSKARASNFPPERPRLPKTHQGSNTTNPPIAKGCKTNKKTSPKIETPATAAGFRGLDDFPTEEGGGL
ncbi:hypothetical protein PNOK_0619200 [Pyrrhoderma noxium]|uniref:Uncharacterized protein n=1 Tax=Pyrrhoderma noxium TaxID=2282107 RepID=A0A286UDN7_9AGAM|nr:hypothetical protein PNOK_0619200 [Pyrrhoderma noxium]